MVCPMEKIRQGDEMASNWEMNKAHREIFNSNQKEWARVAYESQQSNIEWKQ